MPLFDNILMTVDYDHTLTAPDGTIPERNLEAIHYFMDNGGSFTVNTGRSLTNFGPEMEQVPANAPFLMFNGSAAYEKGAYVHLTTIDLDMWPMLNRIMEEFPNLNLEIHGMFDHYLPNAKPEFVDFYNHLGWHYTVVTPGTDIGPFINFALFGKPRHNDFDDMFQYTPEEWEEFDRAQARILELWGDKVNAVRSAARILDVQAKCASKLNGARNLQSRLGKDILVCVGDSENDITMLDGADYAYCPADSVLADRYETVCCCGDGAIADVIYKKLPEILKQRR